MLTNVNLLLSVTMCFNEMECKLMSRCPAACWEKMITATKLHTNLRTFTRRTLDPFSHSMDQFCLLIESIDAIEGSICIHFYLV